MNSNFAILIPARIGSTRLKNKPLIDIKGISLIERVFKNSITITENTYIATDSQEVLQHVQSFSTNIVMTSDAHISGTDRVFEAAENLKINDDTLIINLQGDEPFMPKDLVIQLVEDFNNNSCDVISACHPINNSDDLKNPNCVKVHCDSNNYAKSFQRTLNSNELSMRHIGIYGYRMKTLRKLVNLKPTKNELFHKLEQLRFMDNNYSIYMTHYKNEIPSGIDTQEDVDQAINYLLTNEN
ncbi:3-deoxy-manno-octulosonate cytidylyltransferase [Gammaproteobacteria bacterium]|nr:3-deoxy-manno-octulosonate cytidylyltransferase [Gammaproteobacteria bacterium]MDA7690608.1 3-deoxy-manno-octulosonate cytidylyltransferase [Gammaproteobacteria bacterium]MDA8733483.1 3-deoxy-manno-octulosonate cytidylyltransferase [Gammaproteobacteria bacterium]